MITMQKKLERRINNIATIRKEYPKEVAVTRKEFEQLAEETEDRIPLNEFLGVKLKIID
ncbi:MAG: hypothetical protein J6A89_04050 [Clostridia bacterium]|nr:hypothetical protein [Clostridia bacterium]